MQENQRQAKIAALQETSPALDDDHEMSYENTLLVGYEFEILFVASAIFLPYFSTQC